MKKKGQTFMLSILFAIFIFLVGALFINFLPDEVTNARNSLDCANTAITDGAKLTCLLADIAVPYWILLVLALSGGMILDRILT